ncbi:MAG: ImmA/IrrE family metallo-endopeptidase [Rhodothermaceae bacterium]|nr:ImmA/IrrE family metallo-endopeptidase [Rhodothermaceae bacterium]MYH07565.1 ImmA/IrrE family metallo-endopeptidase [Rhodothermaceae bacterium]
MVRVQIPPEMLSWACERAGHDVEYFARRIPQLTSWIQQEKQPTLNQLEKLARVTHTPFGYLFLPEPPDEPLPVPDYRTVSGASWHRPSPNLLETIYAMQRRQDWLRESLIEEGMQPLDFVASAHLDDDPESVGHEMRTALGLGDGWAAEVRTWQSAVSTLHQLIEGLGVMAVINGVVGNNTHRKLSVEEFRGFALADPYAPLIFVNGADAKSAQMFTLVHELAHIWLGNGGLSGFKNMQPEGTDVEVWCNRAASEFLVPAKEFSKDWEQIKKEQKPFETMARTFKVSPIVAARRALDLEYIELSTFLSFYEDYTAREYSPNNPSSGGNFYNTQNTRVGRLFATRVLRAAKEGRISFKEACKLTGMRDGSLQRYVKFPDGGSP